MALPHPSTYASYDLPPDEPPPSYEEVWEPIPTDQANVISRAQQTIADESMSPTLHKPIAIPAAEPKPGSPFLRAYPPSLESYDISRQVFLDFVDELNKVTGKTPPLQALGLAGTAVSRVPLPPSRLVGGALKAASSAATKVATQGRTEAFLDEANKTIFGPRHLKAEIVKIEALADITNMPVLDSEGRLKRSASLLAPMEDMPRETVQDMTVQERRITSLEPWIAPLDLHDLPDVSPQTSLLARLDASASGRQRIRGEHKILKDRIKAFEKRHEKSSRAQEEMESKLEELELDAEEVRMENDDDSNFKKRRELRKIEREKKKVQWKYEKKLGKVTRDLHREKGNKEQQAMKKVLWLVIREWHGAQDNDNNNLVPELVGDNTFRPELMGDTAYLPELDGTGLRAEADARPAPAPAPASRAELHGTSPTSQPSARSALPSELDGTSYVSELDSGSSIPSELDSRSLPRR